MRIFSIAIFVFFCAFFAGSLSATESHAGYAVTYAGGSLPMLPEGSALALFVDSDRIRLQHGRLDAAVISASAVSELSHGEEIRRKFAKKLHLSATKEYIGITWDKGNAVLEVEKDEYRGILLALEGVTGKSVVEKDPHAPKKK